MARRIAPPGCLAINVRDLPFLEVAAVEVPFFIGKAIINLAEEPFFVAGPVDFDPAASPQALLPPSHWRWAGRRNAEGLGRPRSSASAVGLKARIRPAPLDLGPINLAADRLLPHPPAKPVQAPTTLV